MILRASLLFFFILFLHARSLSQAWIVKNPFEQKVFIENKGQYALEGHLKSSEALFSAFQNGLQYYFTNNSIYIVKYKKAARTEDEKDEFFRIAGFERSDEKEDKEFTYKTVSEVHLVQLEGASQGLKIQPKADVKWYYTYSDPRDLTGRSTLKCRAFKKLVYENIYNKIDLEFYFPSDSVGYKYDFIVHPGGKVSDIKISYPPVKAPAVRPKETDSSFDPYNFRNECLSLPAL